MSSNARLIDGSVYYSPRSLIDFYRAVKVKPTVEIIKQNCVRYEYDAKEIKEICNAFGFSVFDYRAIRNEVYDSINPIAQFVNGQAKLEDKSRIDAAWRHIQDLHFRSSCFGNVIFGCPRLKRDGQKSMWHYAVPKSKITKVMVARLLLMPNLYIMVNTSRSFARKSDEVVSVNALYLDIDNVQDVDGFMQKCRDEGRFDVVEPSKIIASGGGLHIYFYLKDAYAKEKLVPYINRIQKALHDIYPEADKLSDLARFLRLDGGIYNKPKKEVKVVRTIYESDQVYTVPEIGPKLVKPYVPRSKKEKTKARQFERDKPFAIVPQGTWKELELKRVRDMEYLYNIGHFDDDRRKRGIFFYSLFVLRASGSFSKAASMAYELNGALKYPLSTEDVENQLSSVKQNGFKYKYKRDTLVGQLEIKQLTREQQEGLRAIMPYEIKQDRKKAYQKSLRRNEKNLTKRKAEKEKNIQAIKTLLEQGYKQKNIAIELNLTKGYVSQIVKQIKTENQVGQQ